MIFMLDEPQNSIPEENPIPVSPQEPVVNIPINTMGSEPSNMPLEAPESPKNADIPVSLNNPNPENTPISTLSTEKAKPEEIPAEESCQPVTTRRRIHRGSRRRVHTRQGHERRPDGE